MAIIKAYCLHCSYTSVDSMFLFQNRSELKAVVPHIQEIGDPGDAKGDAGDEVDAIDEGDKEDAIGEGDDEGEDEIHSHSVTLGNRR